MITDSYDNLSIGTTSRSAARTVTDDYVRQFADLTWDRHPLHLDPDYAAKSRFGGQIAHGALMISTLLGLVTLDPRYLQCFVGLTDVSFRAPTYFGDSVYAESEVTAIRPRSDGETAVVTCNGSLINQSGTTVLTGVFSFLVGGSTGNIGEAQS
ncbi:MaoC family dehydratase N-terminal domain-containing protein [Rhodococcus fascians]|nr:MaoC family dehydratase N-terminal domain-containing protein [Rhodococcus fascians]